MLRIRSLTDLRHLPRRLGFWRVENPILIYQMGKVGSSAIWSAFTASGSAVGGTPNVALSGDNYYYDAIHTHSHDFVSKFLSMRQLKRDQLIITGIRDLLRRNISAFFQTSTTKKTNGGISEHGMKSSTRKQMT